MLKVSKKSWLCAPQSDRVMQQKLLQGAALIRRR